LNQGTFHQSLFVLSTVISKTINSKNTAKSRLVIDAGLKAISCDSGI
jgi:hypothetical protein